MTAILVALGANLHSPRFGLPLSTLEGALTLLPSRGIAVRHCSRRYRSPPWPPSGQPWYLNAVALCETLLTPAETLEQLHVLEVDLGRSRGYRNQARPLDLDLIDHGGRVTGGGDWPRLPHPRLQERAFVLLPLAEVAPDWRDPRNGRTVAQLIESLEAGHRCEPL